MLVEKYSRMREPALENMANEFRNIIGIEEWKDSDVDAYLISGMLPLIARWTAAHFLELLLKFSLGISKRGWDMVAVDVQFYDTEVSNLRATSRRRFPFLYRTYMFLREARDQGWAPRKLLDERTTCTNSMCLGLRALLPQLSLSLQVLPPQGYSLPVRLQEVGNVHSSQRRSRKGYDEDRYWDGEEPGDR
jgi:hypothetical protein